jgi:hypothetical protein
MTYQILNLLLPMVVISYKPKDQGFDEAMGKVVDTNKNLNFLSLIFSPNKQVQNLTNMAV